MVENSKLVQALSEELKKKDDESSRRQHEYEARIQKVEALLQREIQSRSYAENQSGQQLDDDMRLVTPEVLRELPKKQGKASFKDYNVIEIGDGDIQMDSDGDRRDAGNAQQEPASPQPAVRSLM